MNRKEFFLRLAGLVVFISIINFLANKFFWYSLIWYFDIVMHFLGGFWLGLLYLWLFWPEKISKSVLVKLALWVLALGVVWEIFELVFVNYVAMNRFDTVDTLVDLVADLLGGFCAVSYFSKKVINKKLNI